MNQPIEPDDDLESRVKKLEEERADLLSMTKEVVRLSKLQGFNVQQLLAISGRNEVILGTVLERLDHIEQKIEALSEIKTTQASHSERFDKVERRQGEHSMRFDSVEKTQEEHGNLLKDLFEQVA